MKHCLRLMNIIVITMVFFGPGSATVLSAEEEKSPAAEEKTVVAKVGGIDVTEEMVLEQINNIVNRSQGQISQAQIQNKNIAFYQQGLEGAIHMALLKKEAMEKDIKVEKQDIDRYIANFKDQFPSNDKYEFWLKSKGLTEEDLRQNKQLIENILYQKVLDKGVQEVKEPTDEEMKTFYDENPNVFQQPESAQVSQIFLEVPDDASEKEKNAIKDKLESIRSQIDNDEITFEEAAKQYSEHAPSAKNNGNLGTLAKGQQGIPEKFDNAVFSTEEGTMSDIVLTPIGYHLIKVLEHKEEGIVPLENVKGQLKQSLTQRKEYEALQNYFKQLKEDANIEIVMSEEEWKKKHSPKQSIKINPQDLQINQ